TGSFAQQHIYRAEIPAPEGVDGFTLQAVVYDVLGQSGETQVVTVGRIRDTVEPQIDVLQPVDGDILTAGEPLRAVVGIEDVGVIDAVTMTLLREYQADEGHWVVTDEFAVPLFRNDQREPGDNMPVSDPDNHFYVYWADYFVPDNILRRTDKR